jgi:hypothetical protein
MTGRKAVDVRVLEFESSQKVSQEKAFVDKVTQTPTDREHLNASLYCLTFFFFCILSSSIVL